MGFSGLFSAFQSTPHHHMELTADWLGPSPGRQERAKRSTELLISSDVLTIGIADKCQTNPKQRTVIQQREVTQFGSPQPAVKNFISLSVLKMNAFQHKTKLCRDGWDASHRKCLRWHRGRGALQAELLVGTGHDVYIHLFGFLLKGGPETFPPGGQLTWGSPMV